MNEYNVNGIGNAVGINNRVDMTVNVLDGWTEARQQAAQRVKLLIQARDDNNQFAFYALVAVIVVCGSLLMLTEHPFWAAALVILGLATRGPVFTANRADAEAARLKTYYGLF